MKPKNNKSLALVLQIIFSKCWSQINIFVCIQHFCLCPSHFLIFHLAAKSGTKVCVWVRSQRTQGIFPITWPAVWWGQAPALSSPGGSSQSTGAGGARSPGSRSPGSWGHSRGDTVTLASGGLYPGPWISDTRMCLKKEQLLKCTSEHT